MAIQQGRAAIGSMKYARGGAAVAVGMLAVGLGFGFSVTPANAATENVTDADFSWRVSDEVGGGAYFGGCNFLVAGEVGDLGKSSPWTAPEGVAHYATTAGNVTITKPDAAGTQAQPTWDTKCQDASGNAVKTSAGSTSGNQVNLTAGTGTVDVAANTAEITWDGSFTLVFYGGMTYWSITDPQLTVTDGVGTLTGTASGYGAAMDDPSKWEPLAPQAIELATFSGVELTETGVTIQPDYLGVEVTTSANVMGQVTGGQYSGAFPQSWVDFNELTGQSSYWYSSGGAADPKKPAVPFTVGYTIADEDGGESEQPAPGDSEIGVTIPEDDTTPGEPTEPTGEFGWEWTSTDAVSLSTAVKQGDSYVASGALNTVAVTDTRAGGEGNYSWSLSAQAGDFIGENGASFSSEFLGWLPTLIEGGNGATAGAQVAPGADGGLSTAKTLGSSTTAGSAQFGADLTLKVPADQVSAGDYTATLTVTAIS